MAHNMATITVEDLKQKNMGRVQFLAVRDDVLALLAKGYTRRSLYDELHQKGAVTCSYRRFCDYLQQTAACHTEPVAACSLSSDVKPEQHSTAYKIQEPKDFKYSPPNINNLA